MLSSSSSLILYLAVLIATATLMAYGGSKKGRGLFLVTGLVIASVMGAVRVDVGTDFPAYLSGFNMILGLNLQGFFNDFSDIYEPGIYALAQISVIFGNSPQVFFGLFTLLTILFTYLGIKRYKIPSIWIALMLYLLVLFPSSFNIMRQMLAVAIFFYASSFIFEKKMFKYLLLICLAALFHKSSIILAPLYFMGRFLKMNTEIKTRAAIIMVGGVLFAIIVGPYLISLVLNLSIFEKYDKYQSVSDASTGTVLIIKTLMLGLIAVLYKHIRRYPYVAFFMTMSVIELVIALVARSSVDISRFSTYFSIFPLLLLSYVPLAFKGKSRIIISALVVLYGIAIFYITYFIAGGSEIFPYNFSFTGVLL